MDAKSINTLEYSKILDRLNGYTAFSASAALVRALQPTNDMLLAQDRQARTTKARRLLDEYPEISVGGARDVRPQVEMAARGGVLTPQDFLEIKATLVSGRDLQRAFSKVECECPHLQAIAQDLTPPPGVIESITRSRDRRCAGVATEGSTTPRLVVRHGPGWSAPWRNAGSAPGG